MNAVERVLIRDSKLNHGYIYEALLSDGSKRFIKKSSKRYFMAYQYNADIKHAKLNKHFYFRSKQSKSIKNSIAIFPIESY